MAIVRVLIWDNENYLDRISTPEDTFLIETIDASGSDENIIRIGHVSASSVELGHDGISTFVSGVLSGNFITGTFYGDGLQLDNVVNFLNGFDGTVNLVAGPNVTINSGSNEIAISASVSGTSFDANKMLLDCDGSLVYIGEGDIILCENPLPGPITGTYC